ncbi:MAG: contractile injection system tape measure protein [Terrimicrobiaceae bacterium]
MPHSLHRIRRQRWIVHARSPESAFSIRKRLRDDWQNLLLPAFERVFDQAAGSEETIRIPRIELRLKVALDEDLTGSLPELIHRQLSEQLRRRTEPVQIEGQSAPSYASTEKRRLFEILLTYLRTGSMAWEAAGLAASELAFELSEVCRERRTELQDLLRSERISPSFSFRLFQLVPGADAISLAEIAMERIPHPWKSPLREVLVLLLGEGGKDFGRHVELELAAAFLSEGLAREKSAAPPDLGLIAERVLPAHGGNALVQLISALPASAVALVRRGGKGSFSWADDPAFRPVLPRDEKMPSTRFDIQKPGTQGSSEVPEVLQEGKLDALAPRASRPSPHAKAEDEFPLMVTHAGLVLLHPFLPRCFECTGIKNENGVRLSPFHSSRAAALLHFLATGHEEVYEFDLGFIKVLLGLDPEEPLCVSEGILAQSDKQEAESLLQSAITHWVALKNTSIDGFRSTFVNRRALLREDENGWKMQVERMAFDVLLDKLPWSISVVKLPWMKQPIYTEW